MERAGPAGGAVGTRRATVDACALLGNATTTGQLNPPLGIGAFWCGAAGGHDETRGEWNSGRHGDAASVSIGLVLVLADDVATTGCC